MRKRKSETKKKRGRRSKKEVVTCIVVEVDIAETRHADIELDVAGVKVDGAYRQREREHVRWLSNERRKHKTSEDGERKRKEKNRKPIVPGSICQKSAGKYSTPSIYTEVKRACSPARRTI
jgi:hypothetical protein